LTSGDSHGECLVGIIEGFPAGHRIAARDIERDLDRRRTSYGRSARQRLERDTVRIVSGIWKGKSTGAPIAILIENRGRAVAGKPGGALGTVPRPGHADFAGCVKYGFDEVPPVAERASARGTALRVAVGALAKSVLGLFAIDTLGHVVSIGGIDIDPKRAPFTTLKRTALRSPLFCGDKKAGRRMTEAIRKAKKEGNSLGGAVEVMVTGLPPGLGTYVDPERRLDARLAGAMMSIQSVKAVEIGDALTTYRRTGHDSQDAIYKERNRVVRKTNYAGGIEGGVSNGEDIVIRLYGKPLPTSLRRLPSYDMKTGRASLAPFVRSDVCVMPALSVIGEAVAAWEVLVAMTEKFGGDTIDELKQNYERYASLLAKRGLA
jgi:chorismate synthase